MKFVAISDTHNQHAQLVLPPGDVLLHAGDVSGRGYEKEITKFMRWFSEQPFTHKIFIAGNHDFFFEQKSEAEIQALIPPGVTYLNDSGLTIDGISIWGSPVQPWFHDWAFNRQPGADICRHWELIPPGTRVLITHGPPKGCLDRTIHGQEVGCADLLRYVEKIKPQYHVFGHIHEAYGIQSHAGTTYINASVLDEQYRLTNTPLVFEC